MSGIDSINGWMTTTPLKGGGYQAAESWMSPGVEDNSWMCNDTYAVANTYGAPKAAGDGYGGYGYGNDYGYGTQKKKWDYVPLNNAWSPRNSGRDPYEGGTTPNPQNAGEKYQREMFLENRLWELRSEQSSTYAKVGGLETEIWNLETQLNNLRNQLSTTSQSKFDKEYKLAEKEGEQRGVVYKANAAQNAPDGSYEKAELGQLHARRMQLANEIQTLTGEIYQAGNTIGTLTEEIYRLEQRLQTARTELAAEKEKQQYYEPDINCYQQELDHLRAYTPPA